MGPTNLTATRKKTPAFGDEGRLDKAVDQFRLAARIDKANPEYEMNLAIALANAGRTAEARTAAQAAVQLAPNDPTPRQLLNDLQAKQP